jgi:hypothetical protein
MIIFNTIKKAEHYVKWYSKKYDFYRDGYDWESEETYIDGNLIITRHRGDGCGCGCDRNHFDYKVVRGRIKSWDRKSIRSNKLKQLTNPEQKF